MNRVFLCGRLAADPEVRYGQDGAISNARYRLAVDRPGKKEEGQQNADFIGCITFGKTAEFVEKYLKKGTKILVEGRIQTGSYTNKDGQKVYTTDVVVERHEFVESKASASGEAQASAPASVSSDELGEFMNIPDGIDEALPFK